MSAKQAINDKLQGSVATYLKCGGVVNLLATKLKQVYCWVCKWKQLKSVNIWQSYKQERGCLMHFVRLANTLLKDEASARENHVLACNFAKHSPVLKIVIFNKYYIHTYIHTYVQGNSTPAKNEFIQEVAPRRVHD